MVNPIRQLHMVIPADDIKKVAIPALPAGYTLRTFSPGDESGHVEVMRSAGFDSWDVATLARWQFRVLPEGIFVIIHSASGEIVTTAMATHNPSDLHAAGGELGWVAGKAAHSGHGLGKVVCAAVIERFRAAGYKEIYLKTDDWRLAAIKSYLDLGFVPFLYALEMEERWKTVFTELSIPVVMISWKAAPESLRLHSEPDRRPDSDRLDRYSRRHVWHADRVHRGYSSNGDIDTFGDESLYKPSALGKGAVSPVEIRAGAKSALRLTYTVGEAGLREGSRVTFVIRGQSPIGKDLSDMSVEGPAGKVLKVSGYAFTLESGSLANGEKVSLVSERFEWTPIAGRREFKVVLNYGNGEPEQRLPAPLAVDILPDVPASLEVLVPCTRDEKETIPVRVTARDRFDNRATVDGDVRVMSGSREYAGNLTQGICTIPVAAAEGDISRIAARYAGTGPASVTTAVTTAVTTYLTSSETTSVSNPCVNSNEQQLYIGDLHCHDFLSEAEGYPDQVYRWAIEDKRLDFLSVVPQSHGWHDNETWTITKYMNERYLKEGEFIPFLGFEWQHTGYGDKVIHYLGGDQPYLPVDDPRYCSAPRLYKELRKSEAIVISHHSCYPAGSWCSSTDFDCVETDVERLVELWSMHGSSEGYDPQDRPLPGFDPERQVMAALRKGLRLGFTGGSDSHSGRPGGSIKEPRDHWGGLTGVWADGLRKQDIFSALYQRRTYALTGARIVLRMTVNGAPMGSEIPSTDAAGIVVSVQAPGIIRKIELMKNAALLQTFEPGEDECEIEVEDKTAGSCFYHCRVTMNDGNLAVCSPVWVG